MVKPPKTMQPEAVNLEKAGRAAGKAFQDDSFRNYMARKIDMQRNQFGLVIPPAPDLSNNEEEEKIKKPLAAEVRFAPDVQDPAAKRKKRKRKKKGMDSVLRRLKRRHGKTSTPELSENTPAESEGSHEAAPFPRTASLPLAFEPAAATKGASDILQMNQSRQTSDEESPPQLSDVPDSSNKEPEYENGREAAPSPRTALHLESGSEAATDDSGILRMEQSQQAGQSQQVPDEESPCNQSVVPDSSDKVQEYESSHESAPSPRTALHLETERETGEGSGVGSLGLMEQSQQAPDEDLPWKQSVVLDPSDIEPESRVTTSALNPTLSKRIRADLFFTGVVIMVNGYTNPDTETLQRLMHKHGGDLEKYETSRITHIIAEHLSTAKANIYKRQRKPTPVCHPSWVVECVKAQRLLPHAEYLIPEVRGGAIGSKSITSFFNSGSSPKGDDRLRVLESAFDNASSVPMEPKKASMEQDTLHAVDHDNAIDPVLLPVTESKPVEPLPSPLKNQEVTVSPTRNPASPSRTDDKYISGRVRTTGTDPNFLESFFNQSRLSFIGSYKQRARQTVQMKVTHRKGERRFVFHVDMDCFFASVVLRNFPEYRDRPVAISHQGKKRSADGDTKSSPVSKTSTSECATCNYQAREFGVKKGMFLGRAKELCPDLVVLQYDFEGYEEVSEHVTDILYQRASEFNGVIEQVSCDEAYMEVYVEGDGSQAPEVIVGELAERIRNEIFEKTQCTATVGVGPNRLLAKLATDRAKPNKSFVVDDYRDLVRELSLRELHGIGYRSDRKLLDEGLTTVRDVWDLGNQAEGELYRILGPGLGKKILDACYGRDERPVQPADRKTIGAECNYGVRFNGPYGAEYMIEGLAREVGRRMETVAVRGSKVTLKMKQRKTEAKPAYKFLGHGSCHNLSKSLDTPDGSATRDWEIICQAGMTLFAELGVPKEDIRGMGITLSKLTSDESHPSGTGESKQCITNWFNAKAVGQVAIVAGVEQNAGSVQLFESDDDNRNSDNDEIVDVSTDASLHQRHPERMNSPMNAENTIELHDDPADDLSDDPTSVVVGINDDTECDIALPPLSQIRMSQVDALPSPLREQVRSKIKSNETASNRVAKATIDRRPVTKRAPAARSNAIAGKDPRFRQTDVKRMMRLAVVKSGQQVLPGASGAPVSLTQLESLPLEMQLQVANADERVVGNLLPGRTDNDNYDRKKPSKPKTRSKAETRGRSPAKAAPLPPRRKDSVPPVASVPVEIVRVDASAFFRDNILPLTVFMDENADASDEAVSHVVQFLCLCVGEHGLDSVARLLRTIKNRGDNWSREPLTAVMRAVNRQVEQLHGAHLDVEWLFG